MTQQWLSENAVTHRFGGLTVRRDREDRALVAVQSCELEAIAVMLLTR